MVLKWGIYEINDRTVPVERMCDRAILAVDSIKGQYQRIYAVYDATLREKLLREQAITDAMEAALSEKQFQIYLQPKYSLNTNSIAGAEALVRWIHPTWGFLSPGEFIPLFERNGFITRLDQYIWEAVCAQLRVWKDNGLPLIPVSVNVSRADVYQADLAQTLVGLIQKYDIDPAYLHLEITESAYAENLNQIISTVRQLHSLGFPIEMDDFGSGYSSLSMLGQMEVDMLKLDTKLVQNETAKPASQSILSDIITMAHRMRLSVVAEGVENREQLERLREFGIDYVQGFFFARPMPTDAFEALLRAQQVSSPEPVAYPHLEKPALPLLLIVEENPKYLETVRNTFSEIYTIVAASDCQSALDWLCGNSSRLSAMILSMTLPDNGAGVLMQALRQDPRKWGIPILATIPCSEDLAKLPLTMEADDFLCKCHPILDLRRRVTRLIDTASAHKREDNLLAAANMDYLTGLLNRRGLQEAFANLRKEDLPLAVYLFDLDNLKIANDTYGHDSGDRLIQSFAKMLHRQAAPEDILCRYGGDEFLVIAKRVRDGESALKKGEHICQGFQEHTHVACSCGVALCEADELPTNDLIERADQALYQAKRTNKGSCCLWQP